MKNKVPSRGLVYIYTFMYKQLLELKYICTYLVAFFNYIAYQLGTYVHNYRSYLPKISYKY